jgi:hypothetical protein
MSKRIVYIVLGVALLGAGWYLFRPELLFVKTRVDEEFPGAASKVSSDGASMPLLSGAFHSVAHDTAGTASVHQLADGKRVLRLTDFMTSNGPDVRVYLVAAADATDSESVKSAGFVELGKLKGTEGAQNYDLPAGIDFGKYRAVTIWCARLGVNFATAPLKSRAPETLLAGSFHGVAHETTGSATVYRLADGKRVLRFAGFTTSNGPDVQVYLGKATDASDNETVTRAGFFHLGALK